MQKSMPFKTPDGTERKKLFLVLHAGQRDARQIAVRFQVQEPRAFGGRVEPHGFLREFGGGFLSSEREFVSAERADTGRFAFALRRNHLEDRIDSVDALKSARDVEAVEPVETVRIGGSAIMRLTMESDLISFAPAIYRFE